LADKDIKQRIVLEGEKEYNAALQSAQRNLKVLRSELKAQTAELGKNATEQQKNETRLKNLQKQIKEQEKVVKTYEQALQEVRDKYGDNEEAVAKWEIKLNNARTALANMKSGLDDVGGGLKQTAADINTGITAANSLADSFKKMGEVAGNISDGIETAFTAVVDRISQAVQAIWNELTEVAAKSDNYMDLAAYFGSSATEVQKWDKAMESAGGSLDTVTSLITKLKYGGKDKKIAEWFNISPENYNNDLEFFQQIMQQMYDMRDVMRETGTWDDAMTDIFGNKKGQDVEGVLSDWEDILNGLDRYDPEKGGFGLSNEDISKMADLNVQIETLKTSWETLKEMATVHLFGDLAINVTGNIQNIVDAFKDYFMAEDDEGREEALKKIEENITEIFEHVGQAIQEGIEMLSEVAENLKASDNPVVRTVGEIIGALSDALQWLSDEGNMEKVVAGFEVLATFWLMGKGAELVTTISSLAANFKVIRGSGAISAISGAGGGIGGLAGGAGFGSMLASAGYLAVGLVMIAPALQKLFDPKTWQPSETDKALDNVAEKTGMETVKEMNKQSGVNNQQLLRAAWNRATYTSGDTSGMSIFPDKEPEAPATPGEVFGGTDGVVIPTARRKIDATEEQRAAAEAFWDAWKDMKITDWENEDEYDKAWDAFEKAFGDDTGTFDRLNDMMEKLWNSMDSNGADFNDPRWQDLPSSWWMNPNGEQNTLTSDDISGFRTLPGQMAKAVQSGVSGIRVTMDGQVVGQLVAPYVSQLIAAEIM